MENQPVDLVLEGGGVKGIALVGAYSVLEERGYEVNQVAGTSAGSIVAALLAAGLRSAELQKQVWNLDFADFRDPGKLDRVPFLGKALSVLVEGGVYEGRFAEKWVHERMSAAKVETFAKLVRTDPKYPTEPAKRNRLVVMVSDISRGRLRKFPDDYVSYHCEPSEQLVASAVRASMSIPFYFEPVRMRDRKTGRESYLVDGGLLSNFPVNVFDAPPGRQPRWPTFGIKLSARTKSSDHIVHDIRTPVGMGIAMLKTMSGFYDRLHVDDSSVQDRTIFVDTDLVRATNFVLDDSTKELLYSNGREAALKFLDGDHEHPAWDWEAYKAKHRPPLGG